MPRYPKYNIATADLWISPNGNYSLRRSHSTYRRKMKIKLAEEMKADAAAPKPEKPQPTGLRYIYVIGPRREGALKIGYATEVESRMKGLQCSSPVPLMVHFSAEVDAAKVRQIERACHDALAPHRLRGEWFDVPVETAIETVRRNVRGFMGIHYEF